MKKQQQNVWVQSAYPSRLLLGQFRDVPVERLMRMLNKLGCDIDIVVREAGKKAKASNAIYLQAALS